MGMFRSVSMDLACQRCGAAHRAEVQFKTDDDWCQVYAAGDQVPDLPVGEEWEGIADRFCRSCHDDHRAERERAMATVVVALIEEGQLALRLAEAEAPMTAVEILARGEEQAEAARRTPLLYGATMVLSDLRVLGDEGTWATRLPADVWLQLYQALNEELRQRGWPQGDDSFREDLSVYLDQDRRIQVRLLEARR
jgi:hypothetical protein